MLADGLLSYPRGDYEREREAVDLLITDDFCGYPVKGRIGYDPSVTEVCEDLIDEGRVATDVAADDVGALLSKLRRCLALKKDGNLHCTTGVGDWSISLTTAWEFEVSTNCRNYPWILPGSLGSPELSWTLLGSSGLS